MYNYHCDQSLTLIEHVPRSRDDPQQTEYSVAILQAYRILGIYARSYQDSCKNQAHSYHY